MPGGGCGWLTAVLPKTNGNRIMRYTDNLSLAYRAVISHHVRTGLILLGIAIGVSSVILLTALGDSARRYVIGEFTALGTNLVIILPGRSETTGGPPPLMGETPRDLTVDDALALLRSRNIERVAPIAVGSAPVNWRGREREVDILGTTTAMKEVRHLEMAQGRFLPDSDPRQALPVCVIGEKVRSELFGPEQSLGEWLRIGDRRCRVIGIIKSTGVSIGVDLDDIVMIPVTSAQILFDSPGLFRVLIEAKEGAITAASEDARRIIKERHEGEDDVTIITQDSIVATFDRILGTLTYGIAGIGAVSLLVAGILIMNVMLVSVAQRRSEIGLLKAIGAPGHEILKLFLTEALLLSLSGAAFGVLLGIGGAEFLHRIYPDIPIVAPVWGIAAASGIAVMAGILFGVLPASRAARLDPVQALARH
ncbi:MAG TPA: ABC transporter permease [Gammaproteobacteria bacterium]|nr:ABC transporter permease [Gammaproteobacteria bacterium]